MLLDKADDVAIHPIVILASISINQGEKDQVQDCAELGLDTIFVCGRGINTQASIYRSRAKLFTRIVEEQKFLDPLAEYVLGKCVIPTETGQLAAQSVNNQTPVALNEESSPLPNSGVA